MKVVYLARHGLTEWNLAGRRQGRLDSPLSAPGLAAVRELAPVVARLPVDHVFSSPLGRAVATATVYGEALDLPVEVVDQLQELDHGVMSGLTEQEIEERHPGALAVRARDRYHWRFPGGESYADVDRRAGLALEVVEARGAERPLLVSHEMIGRMLLRRLMGLSADGALGLSHPPSTIYEVDVVERRRTTHGVGAP